MLAAFVTWHGKALALTPDALFAGDADPRGALAIVRGFELLPLDDFIALDRRDSLADAIKAMAAAK